jgi:uncharacterized ion transporter superfamily protein YfcC
MEYQDNEYPDRPWVTETKSETTQRFEKEAEEERRRETKKRHTMWWIIILTVIALLIVISTVSEIEIIKRIAGG